MVQIAQIPSLPVNLDGLFREELRLCGVRAGDTVFAYTDSRTNPQYAMAIFNAASDLGADPMQLTVPLTWTDAKADQVIDCLRGADLVVDLAGNPVLFLYSAALTRLLETGTRVLKVLGTEAMLRRMFPSSETRRRAGAGAKVLAAGKTIRVISDAGTDLWMDKGDHRIVVQDGVADEPGAWDNWAGAFLYTTPVYGSARGTFVIDRGDVILSLNRYVQDPVRISVEDGRISRVEGGLDAVLLEEWLATRNDSDAYCPAHIGWGCDHRAAWSSLSANGVPDGPMDIRAAYGNTQIAFGANYGIGGQNQLRGVLSHIDIVCRAASFYVDDLLVLDHGRFVLEDLR